MSNNSQQAISESRSAINRLAQRLAAKGDAVKATTEQNVYSNLPQASQENANLGLSHESKLTSSSDLHNAGLNNNSELNSSAKVNNNANLGASAEQKNPAEVLQACYQRNMAALFKYEPNIYKAFCSYRPSEPIEILYTKSGVPDVYFSKRREFFYKSDDPIELCKQQVETSLENNKFCQVVYTNVTDDIGQIHQRYMNAMADYQKQHMVMDARPFLGNSCPHAIVLGVGLGYHIGMLYEKIEIGNLIIIEPNADLFYASLYTFDWAGLLEFVVQEGRGLYIMVGQSKEEVFNDLNYFYENHGFMLAGFRWSMIHYKSKETLAMAHQLALDYERVYTNQGFLDSFYFNISHASYLVSHHARFLRKDVKLPENVRDIPLCLVANGTSLSKDLPFLRKVQDKVLIVACGSALETLYNAGIRPLFYAAVERLTIVAENLSLIPDQDYVRSTILLSTDVCHPKTFETFKYTALFPKIDEVFFNMARKHHPELYNKLLGACRVNPLVGNFGVVATGLLGFKNVYLFGLDNGTKQIDMLHPQENLFYKNMDARKSAEAEQTDADTQTTKTNQYRELQCIIPGNFGGEVYSSKLYKNSLRHIEYVIKDNKDTTYHNCSDGAKIDGAEALHSADLLDSWLQRADVDFDAIRDFIENEQTIDLNLTENDTEIIADHEAFYEVVDKMRQFLVEYEKPSTRLDYFLMLQKACEYLHDLGDSRHFFAVRILNSSLNTYFIMLPSALYLVADEAKAMEHAEKLMGLVLDFLDDAKKLYQYVPKYYGDEHRKFFVDNKVGFDHPDSIAPVVTPRKPAVTQEDRDNYPVRKFVKRYE